MKVVFLSLLIGVIFGMWYGNVRMSSPDIVYGPTEIRGKITTEPQETEWFVRFDIPPVRIFVPKDTDVTVGDVVVVKGDLEKPEAFDSFNYPRYLAGKGIYATMRAASVEKIAGSGFSLGSFLSRVRSNAYDVLIHISHGPPQEILAAMTLGYGNLLSQDVGDVLSYSGIRHITAISGLHIMILLTTLFGIITYLGVRRKYGLLITLTIVCLFILLIGAPSSAIRAGIMGGILYAGQVGGRPLNSLRLLLYAAFAMLIWNPYLLFSDIGFQISFSALLGILLLSPCIDRVLVSLNLLRSMKMLRSILVMSISATIFTFPLTLFHFGVASIGGLLMNLAIIPFLGVILGGSFVSVLVGSVLPDLGFFLIKPVTLFLDVIYNLAEIVSSIPFAVLILEPGSLATLIIGYFVIGVGVLYLKKSDFLKEGEYEM